MDLYKQINGSGKFRFTDLTAGNHYDFSIYYQGLLYSFSPEIVHHDMAYGEIGQIPLGWKYFYEIDFSRLMLVPDGMKMKEVLNKIMKGNKFALTPNVKIQARRHEVFLDPKQTMKLHQHVFKQGNYGLIVAFVTERMEELDWVDDSLQSVDYIPVGPDLDNIVY